MDVDLTYLSDLSRVRIHVTDLGDLVDAVRVERSTDGVTWAFVRGAAMAAPSGSELTTYDYEFVTGVEDSYRVTPLSGGEPTGDNLLTANQASIENGFTTGWTASSGCTIDASTDQAAHGSASLEVTSTGSSHDFVDTEFARVPVTPGTTYTLSAEFRAATSGRGVQLNINWYTSLFGGSQVSQSATPLDPEDTTAGWLKKSVTDVCPATAVAAELGFAVVSSPTSEIHYMDKALFREGTSDTWSYPGDGPEVASITPSIDQPWLKWVTRPFLNRPVELTGPAGDVVRQSRGGVFDVVGRTYPVAVTSVRGSREIDVNLLMDGGSDAYDLQLALSTGEAVFLQVPVGTRQLDGGMYAHVGDVSTRYVGGETYAMSLPLREVAPPHHSIAGSTVTWQSVINMYSTWADVTADNPTWSDLLDRVGDPTDVIVP